MNERTREGANPGFELPAEPVGWEAQLEKSHEAPSLGVDDSSNHRVNDSGPITASPAPPMAGPPTSQPINASPPTTVAGSHTAGHEKQAVERAKHIIASTWDDPHEQKKQISLLSAEYMKNGFNKDIKTMDKT